MGDMRVKLVVDDVQLNKTEQAYLAELRVLKAAGQIVWAGVQCQKFYVGAEKCWYTPDFSVLYPDGSMAQIDTKAFYARSKASQQAGEDLGRVGVEDDALVKIKAAAHLYPMYRWALTWVHPKLGRQYRWFERDGGGFQV